MDPIGRQRELERMRKYLDRLPLRDRAILLLHEAGFTEKELAEILHTSVEDVSKTRRKALAALRSILAKEGG